VSSNIAPREAPRPQSVRRAHHLAVLRLLYHRWQPDDNPPAGDNRPASTEPTEGGGPEQETLAFGKSYIWDDAVSVTVGKPKKFKPSETAAAEKANAYLRFTVTVVNKSDEPLDSD
jgi:hypothetical protein